MRTQEEKELLLQDLSARLPYGVKIELTWWVMDEGTCINTTLEPDHIEQLLNDEYDDIEIKPYLRPMSSMTKVEKLIYDTMTRGYNVHQQAALFDWLNVNHFDFHNLIGKGLALKAPDDMYN